MSNPYHSNERTRGFLLHSPSLPCPTRFPPPFKMAGQVSRIISKRQDEDDSEDEHGMARDDGEGMDDEQNEDDREDGKDDDGEDNDEDEDGKDDKGGKGMTRRR
ncbi:hypothetical protein EW146_g7475 [Bondarzewia mesenterica]|uniref:Uncharacterized protein n=1 Tax=Bondarzewia mesenterica TaxID=1095465 RepID=A0A4S4LKP2_9AGAM|nr:hypothetical protein EW146_g7475 [Bondarzewia mesenterica]